jgi:hypothetical protein
MGRLGPDRPTRYGFILKCSNQPSIREDRIYADEGDPPMEGDILEITFIRERMKVRVLSIVWPDQTGIAPAEITVEQIK